MSRNPSSDVSDCFRLRRVSQHNYMITAKDGILPLDEHVLNTTCYCVKEKLRVCYETID